MCHTTFHSALSICISLLISVALVELSVETYCLNKDDLSGCRLTRWQRVASKINHAGLCSLVIIF